MGNNTVCEWILGKLIDDILLPRQCGGWMFVEVVLTAHDLLPIEGSSEVQMDSPFCNHLSYSIWVHLPVVHPIVPDRPWGTRWGTDDPVWILGVDEGSGLLPILSLCEVPRVAVGLEGSQVKGVQSFDIEVAPGDQ